MTGVSLFSQRFSRGFWWVSSRRGTRQHVTTSIPAAVFTTRVIVIPRHTSTLHVAPAGPRWAPLEALLWIISPLSLLLSLRDPNWAENLYCPTATSYCIFHTQAKPTEPNLLTFSWQSRLPWKERPDRGHSSKGQNWVNESYWRIPQILMCLEVSQSKCWEATYPAVPGNHFTPPSFIFPENSHHLLCPLLPSLWGIIQWWHISIFCFLCIPVAPENISFISTAKPTPGSLVALPRASETAIN